MDPREIKALVSLLDDNDSEIIAHVEARIRSLGREIIPVLETEWESSFSPTVQQKIESIIHELQLEALEERLVAWKIGGGIDLLEGMWIVATYLYPDLSYDKIKMDIEQCYYAVWPHYRAEASPIEQVKLLNSVFFGELNFGANTKNFHSAANSMINSVLELRRGNPISLCIVYMYIARRLGMPVYGVNLPSLFVLTYKTDQVQFYINVFNRGIIFSKTDIDHYITQLNLAKDDAFYQPCPHVHIIQRVLRNLILSYEKAGEPERINEVEQLLSLISD